MILALNCSAKAAVLPGLHVVRDAFGQLAKRQAYDFPLTVPMGRIRESSLLIRAASRQAEQVAAATAMLNFGAASVPFVQRSVSCAVSKSTQERALKQAGTRGMTSLSNGVTALCGKSPSSLECSRDLVLKRMRKLESQLWSAMSSCS